MQDRTTHPDRLCPSPFHVFGYAATPAGDGRDANRSLASVWLVRKNSTAASSCPEWLESTAGRDHVATLNKRRSHD